MARNRKVTQRYGYIDLDHDSSTQIDNSNEPFSDNSFDDSLYAPPPTKRLKKNEFDSDSDSSCQSEQRMQKENDKVIDNFDEYFDSIKKASENSSPENNVSEFRQVVEAKNDNSMSTELQFLRGMMTNLYKNSIQILTRIGIIEKSMMKNGNLITLEENQMDPFHEYNTFIASQKLPLDDLENMKKFEENLTNEIFRKEAVSNGAFELMMYSFEYMRTLIN